MGSLDSSCLLTTGRGNLPPFSPLHCVGIVPSSVYLQSVHLSNSNSYFSLLILNLHLLPKNIVKYFKCIEGLKEKDNKHSCTHHSANFTLFTCIEKLSICQNPMLSITHLFLVPCFNHSRVSLLLHSVSG